MAEKFEREDKQFFTQDYPLLSEGLPTDDIDLEMGDLVSYDPATNKCTKLAGAAEPYGIVYDSKSGVEATVVTAGCIIKNMVKFATGADETVLKSKLRTLGIYLR